MTLTVFNLDRTERVGTLRDVVEQQASPKQPRIVQSRPGAIGGVDENLVRP